MTTRKFPRLCLGIEVSDDPMKNGLLVHLEPTEAKNHTFILGKTATGKSELLARVILPLVRALIAFILLDPLGSLARRIHSLSGGRARYYSVSNPRSINFMHLPYAPHIVAAIGKEALNQVVEIETRGANKDMTAKMGTIWMEANIACLERGDRSILAVLDEIKSMKGNAETRDGIIARLNFLLAEPPFRQMLCGDRALDIGDISDNGRFVIFDGYGLTRAGKVFLGNVVTQIVKAFLDHSGRREFSPLALIIDECQNFVSPNWMTILKQGRHAAFGAFLATQDMSGMTEDMRQVLLNTGTQISYRVGAQVARYAAAELNVPHPVLMFIEKYHFQYLTPTKRGCARGLPPISAQDLEPPTMPVAPLLLTPVPVTPPLQAVTLPTAPKATTSPTAPLSSTITHKLTTVPILHWFPYRSTTPNVGEARADATTAEVASSIAGTES